MSKPESYNDLPLSESPLCYEEAVNLEIEMRPLLRYLGAPGDWGYGSKLGRLTQALHALVPEIRAAGKAALARDAEQE